MCGIAGILMLDGTRPAPVDVLERMLQAIYHRGPDEEGRLSDGCLAFGMRRLSIIDLVAGTQPVFNESGRYAVVFNGEIYNYRELRDELQGRGHQLKTQGDTETIIHLFEEVQENCLKHLRGMFGFAIWDSHLRELFLARDRLGIKPLYYTLADGQLIFASEIKAILQHPSVVREVDKVAMSHYLSLKYVPAPRTMFKDIYSLPPAHWLKINESGKIQIQRYWDISFAKAEHLSDEQELTDRLLALLRDSVGIHLRSDVPFGAFLSGGLDSSTIVALMAEQLSTPVKTFSVGFDGPGLRDELPYAQQVANLFGCQHHTLKIGAGDFLDHAERVLFHLDQPIADQATIATYLVARLARQHVKMVLTGEGGDELFAGYARYAGERYWSVAQWLPQRLGRMLRQLTSGLPGLRRAKIAVNALTLHDEATRFANWFPMYGEEAKRHLLVEAESNLSDGVSELFRQHLGQCDAKSRLERMLYLDCKLWLADYLLLRGDKLTMANSLEARVPLLDHKIVEFAASLPESMKLRGSQRKYLLRQAACRLLPADIIHRKKQGFPIPIDRWLRRDAVPLMRDLLNEQTLKQRGYFQPRYIDQMIKKHIDGLADHSTELWGLISLEMWMQKFIDSPVIVSPSSCESSNQTSLIAESKLLAGDCR